MQQDYEKELRKEHATGPTIKAWKFAAEMGFSDSFWEADSAVGFQHFLLNIIISNPIPAPKPSSQLSHASPSSKISMSEEDGPVEGIVKKEGEGDESTSSHHTNGSSSSSPSSSSSSDLSSTSLPTSTSETAMVTEDTNGKADSASESEDEDE
jgi:hypothetical protein